MADTIEYYQATPLQYDTPSERSVHRSTVSNTTTDILSSGTNIENFTKI